MTDIILFDERGMRVPKATWIVAPNSLVSGWLPVDTEDSTILGWGFVPARDWRPTYFAARVARGWRVFALDVGEIDFAVVRLVSKWWKPDDSSQRRFPSIASLEVYVRTKNAGK